MKVVAHRGASQERPEHTRAAYETALEIGADGVECDVRMSADGHLVCVHDRTVDRTSDGLGAVSDLTLAELRALDWDSRRGASGAPGDLITLRELLALVADAGRGTTVAIETKHPTRWGGAVERAVVTELARHGWHAPASRAVARAGVMSFSAPALRRVAELAPAVPLTRLMSEVPNGVRRRGRLAKHVGAAGLDIALVRREPGFVRRLQEAGSQVAVWTVNDPADVDRCVAAGADTIITDRPREVMAQLAGFVPVLVG